MSNSNFKYPFKLPKDYIPPGEPSNRNDFTKKSLPKLFTPICIREVKLKNRIVVSPMCMYSATDGLMNDFHLVHYGTYAKGGAGMVMFEASAVSEKGRISYCDTGIWKDEHIEPMKRIVNYLHVNECKASIQLAHAGRKSSTIPPFLENGRKGLSEDEGAWKVGGASPIPFNQYTIAPFEFSTQEIKDIIKDFGLSAKRCLEAGIDVIELHGAHGYLIDSFLSTTSNKRIDEYGGSFEGRCKFLLDIIKEVRIYWPSSKALFVRLSCTEWNDENGGWTIQDTVNLTKLLISQGEVDLIDCSSGGNSAKQQIKVEPLYQVPFSHEIKLQLSSQILTGAVGLITNGKDAESILQESKADLIFIGRPYLKNPFFTNILASDLDIDLEVVLQYNMNRR